MSTNASPRPEPGRWGQYALAAAAAYNLLWGSWVVLRPGDLFAWTGAQPPLYPGIWQCVGMIVGVYGIGYAIAAADPYRHWPIVLVGLLGKLFGPLGFLLTQIVPSAATGPVLPLSWGWTLVTNDLIWWIPFSALLYGAFRFHCAPPDSAMPDLTVAEANQTFRSQHGPSIAELSAERRVMLLFLRHAGCTFCREALADVAAQREALESRGVTPVLVHMGDNQDQSGFFAAYGLEDVHRISDPEQRLYRAYHLQRGGFQELLGPRVWWRGFKAAILGRHGVGKLVGDGFQMPGLFLVERGEVIASRRHETAADRPDYCEFIAPAR
jgi:peroxiredoxin